MERSSSASSVPDYKHYAYPTVAGRGKRYVDNYDCHISPYDETLLRQSKRVRLAGHAYQQDRPAFFVIKEAGVPCVVSNRSPYDMRADTRSPVSEIDEDLNFQISPPIRGHDDYFQPRISSQHSMVFGEGVHAPLQASPAAHEHHGFVYQRTPSGLSRMVDNSTSEEIADDPDTRLDDISRFDEIAACRVQTHILRRSRRGRDTKVERVLRSLISPRSSGQEFVLDNDALESIFYAANEIFFYGSLKGRVKWDWSDRSNTKFCSKIIGTTALREVEPGKFETLILLSHHYLRDKKYNRRLLISTFLHEMIHSYLFVHCGHDARRCGGHTDGFRRIAQLIDVWAGPEILFLSNMEADLDAFLQPQMMHDHGDVHGSCNMQLPRHDAWASPMVRSKSAWPDIR
ncbi:hypothetical protein PG995_013358 [Apiospora arundinis]|uniref:Zinc finger protein zas1 n=1 Tax=Apiospora arundinis TaxID=335852 RepID=A0ABR2I2U7_9PEZI